MQIVYIVTVEKKCIEVWKLLHTGAMILIQVVYTDDGEGQPIKILKKRNKLYIGIRPKHKILVYDILKNGKLKKIGSTEIPYSLNYINTDLKEEFLFCSYYHANCMSISYIDHNHIPHVPIKIIHNLQGCHSVHIDLFNQFLFLPSLLADRIYFYNFQKFQKNKNFFLEKIYYVNCLHNAGPRHMVLHPTKNYFYSINELNGTIDVWKIHNYQNKIQHIQNISLFFLEKKNQFWSSDIHLTSCGKYLYGSDRLHHIITLFKINSNGTINFIKKFNTVQQPKSFAIDNNNQYLLSLGQKSNTVAVYGISIQYGLLNKLYEYKVGKNPTWILIHKI